MEIPKIIARIKNNKEKSILDPRIKIKKEKQKYMTVKKTFNLLGMGNVFWLFFIYGCFGKLLTCLTTLINPSSL